MGTSPLVPTDSSGNAWDPNADAVVSPVVPLNPEDDPTLDHHQALVAQIEAFLGGVTFIGTTEEAAAMVAAIQNHQLFEAAMAHLLPLPPIPTPHPNQELVDQIMAMLLPAPVEAPAPEPVESALEEVAPVETAEEARERKKSNKGSREIKKERSSSGTTSSKEGSSKASSRRRSSSSGTTSRRSGTVISSTTTRRRYDSS